MDSKNKMTTNTASRDYSGSIILQDVIDASDSGSEQRIVDHAISQNALVDSNTGSGTVTEHSVLCQLDSVLSELSIPDTSQDPLDQSRDNLSPQSDQTKLIASNDEQKQISCDNQGYLHDVIVDSQSASGLEPTSHVTAERLPNQETLANTSTEEESIDTTSSSSELDQIDNLDKEESLNQIKREDHENHVGNGQLINTSINGIVPEKDHKTTKHNVDFQTQETSFDTKVSSSSDLDSNEGEHSPGEPEPETVEEQFMAAIESGNVYEFLDFLTKKSVLNLDINYVNDNGDTPMRLAITSGYFVMVEHLLSHGAQLGDGLLRAVDVGFEETVEKICEYVDKLQTFEARQAVLNCHSDDDYFHPDVTPIILAAQKNDFTLVKLFIDRGCRIKEVGSKENKDGPGSNATDDLQRSVGSLEIYKGLSSEAYLSQANEDPVVTAFKLSKKLRQLSQTDVAFKLTYLELAESTDVIGTEIISYARNTEEIMTVLNYHGSPSKTNGEINLGPLPKISQAIQFEQKQIMTVLNYHGSPSKTNGEINLGPLPKISQAIQFEQKQFVAHQNCQQAILSKFYGAMAFLRDMGTASRLLFLMCMGLGFPILSLLYLYLPITWVKKYIGCPYTKFILKFASDFFFVALLTADPVQLKGFSTDLALQRSTKILLLIWILGIAWREIKCIHRQKMEVFTQSQHWRDILLVVFFLMGIMLDILSYSYNLQEDTSNEVIAVSRRDTSYLTIDVDLIQYNRTQLWNIDEYNETLPPIHEKQDVLRRVARQARKPGRGATTTGSAGQTYNTTSADSAFLRYDWSHPLLIANAFFGVSAVIALLRMLQYVVVSEVIGPLQISLGAMVTQTAHFFLVVGVVLFSFAVGLTYLYSYYDETKALTCDETVQTCERGYFRNLFFATVYLYWSLLGLEDQEALELDGQAQVMEAAGLLIYALFYILMIVVLLNALVAVMSEVYNNIEENADVEWKFHSSAMWMSILLDDDVVPPPFNLLPSYHSIREFIPKYLNFKWKRRNSSYPSERKTMPSVKDIQRKLSSKSDDNAQYKRIMNKLVERYVMGKTADENSVEGGIGFNDILGLRNDLLTLKMDLHQQLLQTREGIDHTTIKGNAIKKTSIVAKGVLHRAEAIHENVDTYLLHTVLNFKTQVDETKAKLLAELAMQDTSPKVEEIINPKPSPPPLKITHLSRTIIMSSRRAKTVDQFTQIKTKTTDQSTQTSVLISNNPIPTEKIQDSEEERAYLDLEKIKSSPEEKQDLHVVIPEEGTGFFARIKNRVQEEYVTAVKGIENLVDQDNIDPSLKSDDPDQVNTTAARSSTGSGLPLNVQSFENEIKAKQSGDTDKQLLMQTKSSPGEEGNSHEVIPEETGFLARIKNRVKQIGNDDLEDADSSPKRDEPNKLKTTVNRSPVDSGLPLNLQPFDKKGVTAKQSENSDKQLVMKTTTSPAEKGDLHEVIPEEETGFLARIKDPVKQIGNDDLEDADSSPKRDKPNKLNTTVDRSPFYSGLPLNLQPSDKEVTAKYSDNADIQLIMKTKSSPEEEGDLHEVIPEEEIDFLARIKNRVKQIGNDDLKDADSSPKHDEPNKLKTIVDLSPIDQGLPLNVQPIDNEIAAKQSDDADKWLVISDNSDNDEISSPIKQRLGLAEEFSDGGDETSSASPSFITQLVGAAKNRLERLLTLEIKTTKMNLLLENRNVRIE